MRIFLIALMLLSGCDKSPDEIFGISNDVEFRTDDTVCLHCHGRGYTFTAYNGERKTVRAFEGECGGRHFAPHGILVIEACSDCHDIIGIGNKALHVKREASADIERYLTENCEECHGR